MAVRLRLRREGTKKQPHYRVVAADKRAPRNGKFIEIIGEYHPLDDPSRVEIDHERALHWLRHGAQPSSQVKKLLRIVGVWEEFKPGDEPQRERTTKAHEEAEAKLARQGRTLAGRDVEEVEAEQAAAAQEATDEPAAEETTKVATADAEDAPEGDEAAATDADATATADAGASDEAAAEAGDEDDTEDES